MIEMFREGGWGMWPILVFGLVSLVSAARYAWDMEVARLRFIVLVNVILVVASLHGMLLDVGAVFSHLTSDGFPQDKLTHVLLVGLKESTRPGAFAGILIVLSLCFVAVGLYRDQQRQLRA
jgi:hypothetical protein